MKILSAIARTYELEKPLYEVLKAKVDSIIDSIRIPNWHYLSRVKELKSYALKLETGRFENASRLEDFFACTIVVENKRQVKNAIDKLLIHFDIAYQKPKSDTLTHKKPESFEFDDLRLYLKLKVDEKLPQGPIYELIFELQIKTFLQHAWSVTTHDLIYKSNEMHWAKHRVAFQVKALLEAAEVSIEAAAGITKLMGLPETNYDFQNTTEMINLINQNFEIHQLPNDMKRLSENILQLITALEIDSDELQRILTSENEIGRGSKLLNLSPYMIIVQSIIYQKSKIILNFVKSGAKRNRRLKLFITDDIVLFGMEPSLVEKSRYVVFLK